MMSTMSEYKRQIVVGVFVASVIALVLAGGAVYLLPLQPTQTTYSTFPSSTTTATSTATSTTTQSTSSGTTSTTPITHTTTATTTATTTGSTTIPTGFTVTVTVTEQVGTVTMTVTTTVTQGYSVVTVTTTTTVTSIEGIEITNAYASSPTQVVLNIKNIGSTEQTITDILVNGKSLSSVNGGTSNPSLPSTIAAGASETFILNFSSPLPSGTYFIAIRTSTG